MMRKVLVVILLLMLSCTGVAVLQVKAMGYGFYDMTGEFMDAVEANPLDCDYEKEWEELNLSPEFSTHSQIALETKYAELWDKELNAVYKKLLALLNPEEKNLLVQAQKGWLQMHLAEPKFLSQTFYGRSDGALFGTQGVVQCAAAARHRIRERTLQLMEYYTLLGGKLEFVYEGQK